MNNVGLAMFSCSRPKLLYGTIAGIRSHVHDKIWERSVMHEDRFGPMEMPKGFSHYKVTSPPLGLGHAFWYAYKTNELKSCDFVIHMEDDWELTQDMDVDAITKFMGDNGLDQVYLSSKKTREGLYREPDAEFGNLSMCVQKNGESFGHLVPNTTPSVTRPSVFGAFVDIIDSYMATGKSPISKRFSGDFTPDNPFLFVKSPKRAWKVWLDGVSTINMRIGFVFGRKKPLLKHTGTYWMRLDSNGHPVAKRAKT